MKVVYEKETCGRCGGCGRYSYNQINGDRCFGCAGTGQRLSKRGRAAADFANGILDVNIEDFAEMTDRRAVYRDALTGAKTTFSKARISGYTKVKSNRDTDYRDVPNFTLMLRQQDGTYKDASISLGAGIKVRLIPTEDEIALIGEYQDSLTKTGKLRKDAPAKFTKEV